MSVNRCVSGSSREVLSVLVGDVFTLRVLIALSQAEVDDIDQVLSVLGMTDEEIVGLNIAMDDSLLMHLLNA